MTDRVRQTATTLFSVERHLESWASANTPNDGWHMGPAFAISREKFEAVVAALATAREEGRREERERCAKIMDDQASRAEDDCEPAAYGACRIGARRIRSGE